MYTVPCLGTHGARHSVAPHLVSQGIKQWSPHFDPLFFSAYLHHRNISLSADIPNKLRTQSSNAERWRKHDRQKLLPNLVCSSDITDNMATILTHALEAGSTTGGQATITGKHPDLWFEDGNIILSVGSTLFRVYRGYLASVSPVFKDMFVLPQPADSDCNEMDGCPIIDLSDSAEDMTNFLKVLFRPLS